jgi:hypothetical protein
MNTIADSQVEIPKDPRVPCVAIRGKTCWLLQFLCVLCGRVHVHGGGPLDDEPDAGHRVSHCSDPWSPDGYELVIARIES